MQKQIDLTVKVVIVSIFLTLLLAISNTYLALKVGLLTAASIPAAILSMGIMKFFKSSTIYEHNLVQTAASSGEAIAGGIGYSVPALVIVGFSHGFNYLDTVLLALTGGIIGVLFSAIIRRPLLNDESLRFPEGQAISEVLKLKEKQVLGFKEMLVGGGVAALIEFLQSTQVMFAGGLKFFVKGASLLGFGLGLSPALIGAGYIVGIRVGLSLLLGGILSYLIVLPSISHGVGLLGNPSEIFDSQFAMSMRYVGVGAMLFAAVITLLKLIKPLYHNIIKTLGAVNREHFLPVHDQDLSKKTVFFGVFACLIILGLLFSHLFALPVLGFSTLASGVGIIASLVFVLIVGFIVAIVCGYFSGLVGVSASPGSSVLIGSLILAALLTHGIFVLQGFKFTADETLIGEAITILIASAIMQIACIANDTMQDLKVGQVIGANPRKQQIMLIFGVVIASLIVPLVMQILYKAYGIAGQMPHAGMDPQASLAAPPAAVMAALTGTIFAGDIPVKLLGIGAGVMLIVMLAQHFVLRRFNKELSYIGVGIGMYLSLTSSIPIVIGAILSYLVAQRIKTHEGVQKKVLLACGMVAGATLMDVFLAIPVALDPNGNPLSFAVNEPITLIASVLGMAILLAIVLKKESVQK